MLVDFAFLGAGYIQDVLLLTRRQMKGIAIVVLGFLVIATAIWLIRRMLSSPTDLERPEALPSSEPRHAGPARPVDEAVAHVLEQAAAVPGDTRSFDALYREAVEIAIEIGGVSVPAMQRRMHIDFAAAHELVEAMEANGLVTAPGEGGKRKVLPAAREFLADQPGGGPA